MSSFYTIDELYSLGLKSFGENVFISRNAQFYTPESISIGNNVRIDDFCILSGIITLGSYIHIAAYCALYGKYGITMENFTGLSPRCTLFSASDNFDGNFLISPMTNKLHNNVFGGEILIKEYSQIGANSVIMPNCTISKGVAVGAMSFVNTNLEEWFTYAGVPAKKLKPRNKGLLKFINEYQ